MSINITTLCKMQSQLLKPLSPRQEYALVVLHVDDLQEGDVVSLATVIQHDYPHVARLYDAFAAVNQHEQAVPFIVPVLNSEEVTEEIFCVSNQALIVAPAMHQLLAQALNQVVEEERVNHPEKLYYCDGAEPMFIERFIDSMLDAYNCGTMPMVVRPTKEQQAMRSDRLLSFQVLRDANLFSGSLDYTKALQPSTRARVMASKLLGRFHRNGLETVPQN